MDITRLILDDHAEQRKLFALLDEIDGSDTPALTAIWGRLRALLDAHAEAEERFFYPRLMEVGTGGNDAPSAAEETEDAIKDHNEIRDAGEAVEKETVGSAAWFEAVGAVNKANEDHLAEEERQGLSDFRRHASLAERHALGIRFAAFGAAHLTGVEPVDKDPKQWVKEHSPPLITLVLARAQNGVIGRDGGLPWHIPADLQRFKALTLGKPMIMGRKTFESLPAPLPGRRHIVLTRDRAWRAEGAEVAHSVDDALTLAGGDVSVIGGAEIFALFLDRADRAEVTTVWREYEGDTIYHLDQADWVEGTRQFHEAAGEQPAYTFSTLIKHRA